MTNLKDLEGNGPDLLEILSRNLPGGSEEDHENFPVRMADSTSEIQNEILQNTNLKRYSHTSLFKKLKVN
jgi:hypothetical protein